MVSMYNPQYLFRLYLTSAVVTSEILTHVNGLTDFSAAVILQFIMTESEIKEENACLVFSACRLSGLWGSVRL